MSGALLSIFRDIQSKIMQYAPKNAKMPKNIQKVHKYTKSTQKGNKKGTQIRNKIACGKSFVLVPVQLWPLTGCCTK